MTKKIGEGGMVAPLILFKGCSPYFTKVPKAFTADTPTLESKPFEAPVVVAVGKAFVQLAPGSDLYDLRAVQSTPLP